MLQGGAMQSPNLGAQGAATTAVMNQPQASGSNGGAPAQPRQRVRARRGQATDPHSIAERVLFLISYPSEFTIIYYTNQ